MNNYEIVKMKPELLLIKDISDRSGCKTITNSAEEVIADLKKRDLIESRRVFYLDSLGELGELVHDGSRFVAFSPANVMDHL